MIITALFFSDGECFSFFKDRDRGVFFLRIVIEVFYFFFLHIRKWKIFRGTIKILNLYAPSMSYKQDFSEFYCVSQIIVPVWTFPVLISKHWYISRKYYNQD